MTTPPEVDGKVRQLDNDVHAIYEMISKIDNTQQAHTTRLDSIGAQVGDLADSFATMDGKVGELADSFATMDGKVSELADSFATMDGKVSELADSFATMDGKLDEVLRRLAN